LSREKNSEDVMNGKVALEEHFAIDDTLLDSKGYLPDRTWAELSRRILDIADLRVAEMDRNGIAMAILSLNAPAIQTIPDPGRAVEVAQRANDHLAAQIAKRPDRFAGLAALPMQDPDFATRELVRCVEELDFRGALVNGFSQVGDPEVVVYYDLPRYRPFWQALERLDVPFYLHPRNPIPAWSQIYEGHPWLMGPTWAFGQETAVHALRLMGCGLLDEYPGLKIILGHLGENLPYAMWRIDNRNGWSHSPHNCPAKKKMAEYFSTNFYLTTSGNFRTQALINAMLEIGTDRIMFSVDYPFESCADAAAWFDTAAISEPDRVKIGRTNALKLFRLGDCM
jgi:gamma-resorcylate decarboxylase